MIKKFFFIFPLMIIIFSLFASSPSEAWDWCDRAIEKCSIPPSDCNLKVSAGDKWYCTRHYYDPAPVDGRNYKVCDCYYVTIFWARDLLWDCYYSHGDIYCEVGEETLTEPEVYNLVCPHPYQVFGNIYGTPEWWCADVCTPACFEYFGSYFKISDNISSLYIPNQSCTLDEQSCNKCCLENPRCCDYPPSIPDESCSSQLVVTDDSYVYIYDPGANYGGEEQIRVGKWSATYHRIGFLKFDLSLIPEGATINSATLRLFVSGWAGVPGVIDIYRVTGDWEESTLSYNNQPSVDMSTVWDSRDISNTGYWRFDVTDLVKYWQNNPGTNKGIMLRTPTTNADWYISSSENNEEYAKPCLMVDYVTPTPTPTSSPTPSPTPSPRPTATPAPAVWFQTQEGDVHSGEKIEVSIPAGEVFSLDGSGGFPGIISYQSGFTSDFSPGGASSRNWIANTEAKRKFFDYFYHLLGSPPEQTSPFSFADVNGGGIFYYNQNVVIDDNWNFPYNTKAIILIGGKLTINKKILVPHGSFLAFIVREDIEIAGTVGEKYGQAGFDDADIEGVYISDSNINTNYDGDSSGKRLVGAGIFVAKNYLLGRDLKDDNQRWPAEQFIFRPDFVFNSPQELWPKPQVWEEIP